MNETGLADHPKGPSCNKKEQEEDSSSKKTDEEAKSSRDAQTETGNMVAQSEGTIKDKQPLRMHAIKCKCGEILSRRMDKCPGCGINIEVLLEELRQDFYRINFGQAQQRK